MPRISGPENFSAAHFNIAADGVVTLNILPIAITNGGTGQTTAGAALTALGGAPLISPAFTGAPTAPTAAPGTNSTQIATAGFVATSFAPLASPVFSGNVGVGGTPLDRLDVRGNLKVASGATAGIISLGDLSNATAGTGTYIGRNIAADGVNTLSLGGFSGIVFRTADTPTSAAPSTIRMALDTGGNLIIPAGQGSVAFGASSVGISRLTMAGQSAAGGQVAEYRSGPNGADSTTIMIHFTDFGNTADIGRIARTGTNQVVYTTTSDIRLKRDIAPSERGLEAVMAITVADYNIGETRQQGLIAQELFEHYPEAVIEGGEDPATQPWSMDYGRLTPLLTRAIQQQQARIDGLEARLAAIA